MVILHGMPSPHAAVEAAHRAWDAGVELFEVPIGQKTEVECLAAVVDAAWLLAVGGPFPEVKYLATGGISLEAASEYLRAGARIVAFGPSTLTGKSDIHLAEYIRDLQHIANPIAQKSRRPGK